MKELTQCGVRNTVNLCKKTQGYEAYALWACFFTPTYPSAQFAPYSFLFVTFPVTTWLYDKGTPVDGLPTARQQTSQGRHIREGAQMYTQVTVRDELAFRLGRPPVEFILGFPSNQLTVRELIRARIEQEVAAYNERQGEFFQGLVQPGTAELTLNGYRLPRPRYIDPANQVERAFEAFMRNGFLILIDDRQVEQLDDSVILDEQTVVTFLKLVPLVGG